MSKTAIVTGASSGIGEACCQSLLEQGAFVFGCARREERLAVLEESSRWSCPSSKGCSPEPPAAHEQCQR